MGEAYTAIGGKLIYEFPSFFMLSCYFFPNVFVKNLTNMLSLYNLDTQQEQ